MREHEFALARVEARFEIRRQHDTGKQGADKRRLHGSNGATVFRDPSEPDRIWAIFDWDAEGWKNFVSDPEVPAILQEAGHMGKPQAALLLGHYEA